MAAPPIYGSFRYNFAEKREKLHSRVGSEMFPILEAIEGQQRKSYRCCSYQCVSERIAISVKKIRDVVRKAIQMGIKDPRKVVFAMKQGLALVIVSLLIFFKEPALLSRYSVWAILTVVVTFEFSIGATLSKGFNRWLGTLVAGGLALGMAILAEAFGDWEEAFIITSIFLTGSLASYIKLYPTMKPYEYGFRVFLLTYCFVMVSGNRTREFIHTAKTRFLMVAIGAAVGLAVNLFIYPIWAGEDLHALVAKNFSALAKSLEGCTKAYLNCVEYERIPSMILTYQASDDQLYSGIRSAVESTSQEDSLMSFAIWEPPHGPYKGLRYPWKSYVQLSGALRHCAFTVMALHGCILSEIQAPPEKRHIFLNEMQRVGMEGAKVLREIGNKVKNLEKLAKEDILFEVQEAAEQLQKKIDRKSYLFVNADSWEIGTRVKAKREPQDLISFDDDDSRRLTVKSYSENLLNLTNVSVENWDLKREFGLNTTNIPDGAIQDNVLKKQVSWSTQCPPQLPANIESKTYENASALSLATFMSLLIEFVARLQNIVDAFQELSEAANFKEPVGHQEM